MSDVYVVLQMLSTLDDHGVYVTKDSSELIEVAWMFINAVNLEQFHKHSVFVRPTNTPITVQCTELTGISWEHVQDAGTLQDAVTILDRSLQDHVLSKGAEFTFVMLNAFDLKVQLFREANDKQVTLPSYLRHPRIFDLRKEYALWQAHHPEAAPYSNSSLSSMCVALDILERARSTPKRAMDGVIVLANLLISLIQRSQPFDQHSDVLTRPLDCEADMRAFLSERSRVVYLSNLPHDTTQSELESWFTQYGGRPVAFWTLRQADMFRPSETGFAVFSSHEEAVESLSMSGRALNERAIEVAPSSNRVLERAQEILTPFPQSKNRPRPGDWTCPSCGFSNFQRRTACFRCQYPSGQGSVTGAATLTAEQYVNGYRMTKGAGVVSPSPPAQNTIGANYNQSTPHHRSGSNGMARINNSAKNNNTASGSGVPFRAGDWKCGKEGCNYHNFAKNTNCLRCGSSRLNASVVGEPHLKSFHYGMQSGQHHGQIAQSISNQHLSGQSLNYQGSSHGQQHYGQVGQPMRQTDYGANGVQGASGVHAVNGTNWITPVTQSFH